MKHSNDDDDDDDEATTIYYYDAARFIYILHDDVTFLSIVCLQNVMMTIYPAVRFIRWMIVMIIITILRWLTFFDGFTPPQAIVCR